MSFHQVKIILLDDVRSSGWWKDGPKRAVKELLPNAKTKRFGRGDQSCLYDAKKSEFLQAMRLIMNKHKMPMTIAMEWVSKITTISLSMALPGVGGIWIDNNLGTMPVFIILGVVLGFALGMYQLLQIASEN